MARERLSDHVGPDILWPSVSVIEASGISPAERKEADERWWQERKRQESSEVEVSFDPSCFEWVRRDNAFDPAVSIIRITSSQIAVTLGDKDMEMGAKELLGAKVEIGFAPAAIAIRRADRRGAFYVTIHPESNRRGIIKTPSLLKEAQRRGFKAGMVLEARWDPKHRMLVGIKPKEAQEKGRRAG